MPIYEYQCTKCNHQLDAFQKISEPPLIECPNCHQPTLNKLVSAAGFQLKGGGWYVTDYRQNKAKTADDNKPTDKSTEKTNEKASTDTKSSTDNSSSAASS